MTNITVGIPRGLLYHRYGTLWKTFFKELGVSVVLSDPTTQAVAEDGSSLTIDEACLPLKLFFGHVNSLIGKCDYILIPRVHSYGKNQEYCVRFSSLYDMTANIFRSSHQKFLLWNVDESHHAGEEAAFRALGHTLGCLPSRVHKAYLAARKEDSLRRKAAASEQLRLLSQDGLKILIAAHSYVIEDPYIGKPILDFLRNNNALAIRTDCFSREQALKHDRELSATCKWEPNREINGALAQYASLADGIILLSAFPCGPDAMTNELILRRIKDKPILNLILDGQNGTAGVETRLESFLDIIRFKKGLL